jgi:hypothetical protein
MSAWLGVAVICDWLWAIIECMPKVIGNLRAVHTAETVVKLSVNECACRATCCVGRCVDDRAAQNVVDDRRGIEIWCDTIQVKVIVAAGPIIFGILGLWLFFYGYRKATWLECSLCGGKLSHRGVSICPHCNASFQ